MTKSHTCKDCEGTEPECEFSVNLIGEKNDYCSACVDKRIKKMILTDVPRLSSH